MASRQNREARPEYPTGHNRGNDSPDRNVGRRVSAATPVETPEEAEVPTFGSPIGVEEVSDADKAARLAEREEMLARTPKPGAVSAAVEADLQASRDETKRAELEAAADARTAAAVPSPTADLSARGAMATLKEMKERTEREGRGE